MNNQYTFASEPRAVAPRRKYRDSAPSSSPHLPQTEEEDATSNNIMFDRRVMRGNTYGGKNLGVPGDGQAPAPVPRKFRRRIPAHKSTIYDLRPEVRRRERSSE